MRSVSMRASAGSAIRNRQKTARTFASYAGRDTNAPQEYRVAYQIFTAFVIVLGAAVALVPLVVLWSGIQHQNGYLLFAGVFGTFTTYAFAWSLWCDERQRDGRRQ